MRMQTFKNPNATLLNILSASGPVPEANGASAAASKPDTGKRKRANKNVSISDTEIFLTRDCFAHQG